LLTFLKINIEKGVAIALNNEVVPKSNWNNCTIKNNDKLLLIKAAQGG
jgi:sulfur carrier protein